jgi:hypothetical protein
MVLGEKTVSMLGEYHEMGLWAEQKKFLEDLVDVIKHIQEERDFEPLHILWEKTESDCRQSERQRTVLLDLDTEIEKEIIPGVIVEDVEIRLISTAIRSLLKQTEGIKLRAELIREYRRPGGPAIGTIRFQDFIDECSDWLPFFRSFLEGKDEGEYVNVIAEVTLIEIALEFFYDYLKKSQIDTNELIFDRVKQFVLEDETLFQELEWELERMITAIDRCFDVHLLKKIVEYKGKYLLVYAGAAHVRQLAAILASMNALIPVRHRGEEICGYIPEKRKAIFEYDQPLSKEKLLDVVRGYYTFRSYVYWLRMLPTLLYGKWIRFKAPWILPKGTRFYDDTIH